MSFYQIQDEISFALASFTEAPTLLLNFYLDEIVVHRTRSIYSPLDFLGDIGGLLDALNGIGYILVGFIQLITGSGLKHYLLSKIFTRDISHKIASLSLTNKLSLVTKRKAFYPGQRFLSCLNKGKEK